MRLADSANDKPWYVREFRLAPRDVLILILFMPSQTQGAAGEALPQIRTRVCRARASLAVTN
jgi:hypothetical protein